MTHVKICVGCPAGPPRSGFRSGGQAAPSCAFACSIRATARMISSGVRAGPQPVIGIGGRGVSRHPTGEFVGLVFPGTL